MSMDESHGMHPLGLALKKMPCVIEFDGDGPDAKPFDVMTWGGDSCACEWSKRWNQLLVDRHGGSFSYRAPNQVMVYPPGAKGRLLWVASGVTLFDGSRYPEWFPSSAEEIGFELITDATAAIRLFEDGYECSSPICCCECDDYFPAEDDVPCEHIWYCGRRCAYVGLGVGEKGFRYRCSKSAGCGDCDQEVERRRWR